MDFMDRKIIDMRQDAIKQEYKSIHDPYVFIAGQRYSFIENKIFDEKISIYLPEDFIDMPQVFAKRKFPLENRPKIIKTNIETSINFGFNWYENEETITALEIPKIVLNIRQLFMKVSPHYNYFDYKVQHQNDNKSILIGWFDYTSPTIYTPVYSFQGFMPIDKKIFHIFFTCEDTIYEHWKPIVLQIIQTIKKEG